MVDYGVCATLSTLPHPKSLTLSACRSSRNIIITYATLLPPALPEAMFVQLGVCVAYGVYYAKLLLDSLVLRVMDF